MKHFLLPGTITADKEIKLDLKDTHYIKNVLRLKEGASFSAIDRSGAVWKALIISFEGVSALLKLAPETEAGDEQPDAEAENIPEIVLFPCLLKGKKMDLVIRQASEAGAAAVIPVISEFSVAKLEEKNRPARLERWRRVVREAVQQSGSSILTRIEEPVELRSLTCSKETSIFFHEKSIDKKSLHQYLESGTGRINILTGPEGGLSGKEVDWLLENNFKPAYLGRNTLRAETAAIYALAAVKTILLEKKTWKTTA